MTGRSTVVTGGSRGIGRAVVERLRAGGDAVTKCGRGARPADLPDDVQWVTADVADPSRPGGSLHSRTRAAGR